MNRFFLRILLAGLIPALAYSQTTTFRVETDLVLTPVLVEDTGGTPVRNLKLKDFEIEENGISVGAARLGKPGEAPLELGLLFDTSGSMISRFDLQRQAAIRFLKQIMRPIDSVFLLSISNTPIILQNRTSSLEVAVQAADNIHQHLKLRLSWTPGTRKYGSNGKADRWQSFCLQ